MGELEEALRHSAARLEEARGGGCVNGCPLDLRPEIQVARGLEEKYRINQFQEAA